MNGNIALDRPSASSSSHGQTARAHVAQTRRFSSTPQTHDLRHDSSTVSARQCLVYINTLHSSTCLFIDEGFDGNPRSLIKYLFIFSCLLIGFQTHLIFSWRFIFMFFYMILVRFDCMYVILAYPSHQYTNNTNILMQM